MVLKSNDQDAKRYLQQWVTLSLAVVFALTVYLAAHLSDVAAQSSGITWSTPENLSNTPQSSVSPAIVADQYGYVHVFWSEDTSSGASLNPAVASAGNTIYYTRWDGKSWTTPVDVLYVPDDPIADQMSVTVDKAGVLQIVWTGLVNIYYSKAPALQAGSAQAWLPPVIISTNSARTALESSIAVDDNDHVHIIYATRGSDPGVYHVESPDGETWSEPQKLSEPFDTQETSFSRVKIIADSEGRLHAVWQTSEANGYGQAVYYVHSADQGVSWSSPLQMAYRQPGDFDVGLPYIMAARKSELHLIYTGGATVGAAGRYERVSTDGGETWSQPRNIITEMIGINGYVVPLADGAGQLHLIINMRTVTAQKVGIYYSSWTGDNWSPVVPLVTDIPAADSAHYTAAVISRGNEIHIVWNQIHGGEIWHLRGIIQNVAPAQVNPLPTITPVPTVMPTANPAPILPAQPSVVKLNPQFPSTSIDSATNSPLIPGVIAALILIMVIVLVQRVSRLRRML